MIREICCHIYIGLSLSRSYSLWTHFFPFHKGIKNYRSVTSQWNPRPLLHILAPKEQAERAPQSLIGLNVVVILEAVKDQIVDRT
jgi:hypothetical protein